MQIPSQFGPFDIKIQNGHKNTFRIKHDGTSDPGQKLCAHSKKVHFYKTVNNLFVSLYNFYLISDIVAFVSTKKYVNLNLQNMCSI